MLKSFPCSGKTKSSYVLPRKCHQQETRQVNYVCSHSGITWQYIQLAMTGQQLKQHTQSWLDLETHKLQKNGIPSVYCLKALKWEHAMYFLRIYTSSELKQIWVDICVHIYTCSKNTNKFTENIDTEYMVVVPMGKCWPVRDGQMLSTELCPWLVTIVMLRVTSEDQTRVRRKGRNTECTCIYTRIYLSEDAITRRHKFWWLPFSAIAVSLTGLCLWTPLLPYLTT